MAGRLLTEFSDSDALFLIETVAPGLVGKIDIIKGDPAIIERILDQEAGKLFQRIMLVGEERIMARVTPRLCEVVGEEHRFGFYRRIADFCLFILGMFPEYVASDLKSSISL